METGRENRRYREPLRARRWRRPCGGGECDGRQLWGCDHASVQAAVQDWRGGTPPSLSSISWPIRLAAVRQRPGSARRHRRGGTRQVFTGCAYLARSWGDISISPKKKLKKANVRLSCARPIA